MDCLVRGKGPHVCEASSALITGKGPLPAVMVHVGLQAPLLEEAFATLWTLEGPLPAVCV